MHDLYMASISTRRSKLGHGYFLGNHPLDDIGRFKKRPIIFILHLGIYFIVFLVLVSIFTLNPFPNNEF